MTDLSIQTHGSIVLLRGETGVGRDWIAENISPDSMSWAGAIVVEHRFIGDIICGAVDDGLEVES
jgi:transcriptional regulator with PAS, ATPase and Fis domain